MCVFNAACIFAHIFSSLISEPGQVYTCLIHLDDGRNTNLIFCCLSKRVEGLDLFIPELDWYAQKIKDKFQILSVTKQ